MDGIRFEWDERKNLANQKKHGLSFEEAIHVFEDPFHVMVLERIERGEERWQTFGVVRGRLLLMVGHTIHAELSEEPPVEVYRIITARQATTPERKRYEEENS